MGGVLMRRTEVLQGIRPMTFEATSMRTERFNRKPKNTPREPLRRAAMRGQYPLLVLIVGYTMISLWIMAQPVVAARAPPT